MNEFCDKHIDIAKLRYRKKYFDDYKDNSRKQWQMMNELLNRRKSNIRVNKLIDKLKSSLHTDSHCLKFQRIFC